MSLEKSLELLEVNNSKFLIYILKKDFKSAGLLFFQLFNEFSDNFDGDNIVINYEKILNCVKCFRSTFISSFDTEKSIILRKLLILSSTFDALNSNYLNLVRQFKRM